MESWRKVWRDGVVPSLSTNGLKSLLKALESDDPKLTQGSTTTPPPMQCVLDWPCEGACVIGYCAWQGDGLETVGEVESKFAEACFECDSRFGEPASVRYFLNFWDDTPRDELRKLMIPEVSRALAERLQGSEPDRSGSRETQSPPVRL